MEKNLPSHRQVPILRALVDRIDRTLLRILAQRSNIISELAISKQSDGLPIKDTKRESDLLEDRRSYSQRLGLNPDIIDALFRLILWASRETQASLRSEVPTDVEPLTISIVGAHGGMGKVFSRLFADIGHTILEVDLTTDLTINEAVPISDVVVVSVPINQTVEVIRKVGPLVKPDSLLMDVTSIKGKPLKAMLESTSASVLGTHPMFGPRVHSLQGQRLVLCEGRGHAWYEWAKSTFESRGLSVHKATSDEHDKAMAIVQVLNHYQTQVFGLTLARLGRPISQTLQYTSPAYLMELYVAGRHFAQSPNLYGPIEMNNPELANMTEEFQKAAKELSEVLIRNDQEAFSKIFSEVRQYFGEFSSEAFEQSSFLIDRLVERAQTPK